MEGFASAVVLTQRHHVISSAALSARSQAQDAPADLYRGQPGLTNQGPTRGNALLVGQVAKHCVLHDVATTTEQQTPIKTREWPTMAASFSTRLRCTHSSRTRMYSKRFPAVETRSTGSTLCARSVLLSVCTDVQVHPAIMSGSIAFPFAIPTSCKCEGPSASKLERTSPQTGKAV